jgi:hypothetical protein
VSTIFSFRSSSKLQTPNQTRDCPESASCAKKGGGSNVSE